MKACKLCKGGKLRKELTQPFDQAGWYTCENCGATGPLLLISADFPLEKIHAKE